jgi:signal transduction histidine kinase
MKNENKDSNFKDEKPPGSFSDELIYNAPVGIFAIDPSGALLMENPALKKIFESGVKSVYLGVTLYNYISSTPGLRKFLDDAAVNKKPVRIDDFKYAQHPDKKEKVITVWIVPVLDSENALKYFLFLVEDMTQYSLFGSKIQRADKLSAIGIMASGIAEEIKWPLSHILINLDFVERNTSEDSPMKSYLQAIKDDLSRIKFVSKQIMNLSLPQSDEDKVPYEVNNLFLSQPIKVKLNVLRERGIVIKTLLPDKSPVIKANENHLIQAMTHIIQNAAEAMPEDGTLTISVESVKENEHDIAVITIGDTGMGISKENIKKIFKPFFSTKGQGATGLGLMVAYSIIDKLGGAIGIKSIPGEGTFVRIALPVFVE